MSKFKNGHPSMVRSRRAASTVRTVTRAVVGALGIAIAAVACDSNEHSSSSEPLAECEAYVAAYEHCMIGMGDRAGAIVKQRAADTRAAFNLAAKKDEASREATRVQCEAATQRLTASCR